MYPRIRDKFPPFQILPQKRHSWHFKCAFAYNAIILYCFPVVKYQFCRNTSFSQEKLGNVSQFKRTPAIVQAFRSITDLDLVGHQCRNRPGAGSTDVSRIDTGRNLPTGTQRNPLLLHAIRRSRDGRRRCPAAFGTVVNCLLRLFPTSCNQGRQTNQHQKQTQHFTHHNHRSFYISNISIYTLFDGKSQ